MKRLTLATLGALAVLMSAQALAVITFTHIPVYIQPQHLGWEPINYIVETQGGYVDAVCSFQTTGDDIPIHLVYTNFKPDADSAQGTHYIIKHPGAVLLHFKGKPMTTNMMPEGLGIYAINEDYDYSAYAANTLIVQCSYYDYHQK